ncbi:retrotransposon protein, putative, ty1-copia subclass, partial [Tanacetum coccineum]
MVAAAQNTNNSTIRSVLHVEKFTGSNFKNWHHNLRIVRRFETKLKFMKHPMAPAPDPETADPDTIDKYYESISLEKFNAYDMLKELKTMFEEQAKQELFEIVKAFQEDGQSGKDKGKNKLTYAPKPKISPPPKRDNPAKDSIYHHFKEVGHWRRNCPSYQAELRKKKNANMPSTSGSKKLKHGALSLYVGNEMRAAVEAIGGFDLVLLSGLIIILDNYHFTPTITKGVVSISHLVDNGYIHTFTNYGIFVSKDNVFCFNAIPHDGIYEIDMHNLYPNVSSIYNVSNKRVKHELDSSYLWHCHLGHINKKHMDKLQRDGILQPTHDESLEKCKSCISGKMAHGASYFITFTDDFSRYGYVYLMKHKHEVFETFKVFQNEVENQLGKKIKAIRSDRGGKYLNHEYINHIKSCGIVSHLTPPCTPKHNRVSERRNRTLLDMVRSMLNLTTLPKSFWGYALESTTRILNMVPTKKVDRTSFGRISQAPNRYGFYVDAEEHELGDLNEPPNYKVALSDPEFDKWLDAINTEMQPMKDNQVSSLVNLPPNGRTIRTSGSNAAFLVLYVDDILIMKNNVAMLQDVKSWLCKCFPIKDLGEATYILGIKIIRDRSKRIISLSQSAYFDKNLKKFKMENSKCGSTLMIDYTVVKTILKYLRNTKDMVLVYGANPEFELKVTCYADAGFQTDKDDTKSRPGYVFILNGGAVDWKSAKQSTTIMSFTEAGYIATAEASMEAV